MVGEVHFSLKADHVMSVVCQSKTKQNSMAKIEQIASATRFAFLLHRYRRNVTLICKSCCKV